jgi:hypothetical protein
MGSITPFIIIPGFMALISERCIVPEEAKLEAAFGRDYLEYKARSALALGGRNSGLVARSGLLEPVERALHAAPSLLSARVDVP